MLVPDIQIGGTPLTIDVDHDVADVQTNVDQGLVGYSQRIWHMVSSPSALVGLRILIIEDERFAADYIDQAIVAADAIPLGPVGAVSDALKFLDEEVPDVAILKVRLRDQSTLKIADKLLQLRIPFLFLSAMTDDLPVRLLHIPLLQKPFAAYQVVEELCRLAERRPRRPMIRGH